MLKSQLFEWIEICKGQEGIATQSILYERSCYLNGESQTLFLGQTHESAMQDGPASSNRVSNYRLFSLGEQLSGMDTNSVESG